MYSTNFEVAAFVLSLLSLIYCLLAKRRQYVPPRGFKNKLLDQHFVFIIMLLSNILSAVSSVGGVCVMNVASDETAALQYTLHACYFFFHALLSVSFCLYVMNLNGTSMGRSRLFYWMFFMPFIVSELLILTNKLTGLAFYMDSQNIYHRGPMMLLLYVFGGFYVEMGFYFFYRYKRAVPKRDSVAIGVVLVMATAGIVIQAVFPKLLLELFSEALACLAIMVLLEERRGQIDYVTGTLNRTAFTNANRRLIETGQSYGVVLIGLSDIEVFSGMFSGGETEELQMNIASWLTSISSGRDVFCFRQTGFAIICSDASPHTAEGVARAVVERFAGSWRVRGMSLSLAAAVSVVRVPDDVATLSGLEELLSSDALKATATRQVSFGELTGQLHDRRVEEALRRAVETGALRVWYQPIWSVEEHRTVAAEALLRVDDDELRALSPEEYIPIAEKTGLISEIGLFVFEEVCSLLSSERERLRSLSYIELNLSIYQFMYGDLVSRFEELRKKYDIAVDRINLEITESASTQGTPAIVEALERLRSLGYTLSLDDFGSGYSNLMQLISSKYKNVKMDKSLLWDAERNQSTAQLLDSMVRVIRSLGFNVVQEGVETEAQLSRSTGSGCNLIQGYLFSRPIPKQDFISYLSAEKSQLAIM